MLLSLGIGPVLEHASQPEVPVVDDGIPIVASLAEVLEAAPPTEFPERPIMIKHRVLPRERINQIAVRYGVTRENLLRWNKRLDPNNPYPKGHRRLRVRARRIPAPRHKVRTKILPEDNWLDIAVRFRVELKDLHAYNWRTRTLVPGELLTLWVDPGWPQTIHPGEGPAIPEHFDIEPGALSVGRPNRGRLTNGIQLPLSDLYTRKTPTTGLWGSSHTIEQIHRAFAIFRHDTGFTGDVVIGAISRRRGGRFSPHVSHQSGRDVDIRLPLWPGVSTLGSPHADEIDWLATWGLVKAFVETDQVQTIFLDISRHRNLYEAARTMGETPETLEPIIKWPRWSGSSRPVVRHSPGHDTHIHVRIKCGDDEPRCRTR
ncbi:MAG: penicillin-insensitive murein endopeptidase [Deltaproteobacteria bacterium]|nr:penicillin-insensitive murein endopeptidase [Deltaproteobacteria bacterium]